MQLREIRIGGFGTFADTRVQGLAPGLNVLHGPNEFGKTTLLEFVRRVLFGFPARRGDANLYPSLHGGQYGGQLVCEMRDGRTLTVSRTSGKSGGALSVKDQHGDAVNEDAFYGALGTTSSDLYHNVFSVGLEELYKINVISLPEVKDRVYGAGLGLGDVSVTDLKKSFADEAEKLYRPRGSTQRMNAIVGTLNQLERQIRERTAQLGKYDEKVRSRDQFAVESGRLREQLRNLQSAQRSLGHQKSLYGTFAALRAAEDGLLPLADVPDIPDEMMDEVTKRQQAVDSIEERQKDTRTTLTSRRAELAALIFDPALLEHERQIKALSRSLAQYRDARRDLPVQERERQLLLEEINRGIRAIGEGWTEERVRAFVVTAEQNVALREREDAMRFREKAAEKSSDRLDDHRQQTRTWRATPTVPAAYRIIGAVIFAFGLTGCIYSAVNGYVLPAAVSGVAAALGLVVALSLGSSSGPLRDKALAELEQEQREAARLLQEERAAWSALLEQLGLAPSLPPAAVTEQLQSLRTLQASLRTVDERTARIDDMQAIVNATDSLFAQVAASLAEPVTTSDVAAGIETIDALLDKAQDINARKEALRREVAQLDEKATALAADLAKAKLALDSLVCGAGATNFAEFAALHERSARARALRADISKSKLTMQAVVGVGEPYDTFVASLESTNPEDIAARLVLVDEQLAAVSEQLESTNRSVGGLDVELSDLVSSEELLVWEAQAEEQKQQLRDAHREWLCARFGLWAVEQAVSRYETTRQPAVVREAQTAFALMTGQRYTALLSPLGSDDLRVRDSSGNEKSILNELSRGTKEQLYLAMRLGLIEQYELNAEPLPVIMDDILVNFDDERGPLAVQALAAFAKNRQVIVMTCHESTREMYRQAGATELVLERVSLL